MKQFACRDVGYKDCDYKVTGADDQEVLTNLKGHAFEKHGIKEFSADLINKVKSKIYDVKESFLEHKAKSA